MLVVQLSVLVFIVAWAFYVSYRASKKGIDVEKRDSTNSLLFIIPVLAVVFLLTVLRDISTGVDTSTYAEISERLATISLYEAMQAPWVNMELGLLSILKALSHLNFGLIPFLAVTTALAMFAYYRRLRSDSKIVWLSAALTFGMASYFFIFNGTAQMVAALIPFLFANYIYEGKFKKFLVVILLTTLIHKTAIFMLPMYFVLRYWPKTRRGIIKLTSIVGLFVILGSLFLEQIVQIGAKIAFPEYADSVDSLVQVSWMTILRAALIAGFVLFYIKYISFSSIKERVWFNATMLFLIISIFAAQFGPFQRFGYFLLPFLPLVVTNIIAKMPSRKRKFHLGLAILIVAGYIVATNMVATEYYNFIWSNHG